MAREADSDREESTLPTRPVQFVLGLRLEDADHSSVCLATPILHNARSSSLVNLHLWGLR